MERHPVAALVLAVFVWPLLLTACRGGTGPSAPARLAPSQSPPLHVLMINGGGSPAMNFQSHLLHVEQLLALLGASGVSPKQISIFSGDGADPTADLAVRETEPEATFWLLRGTRLGRALAPPITHANSALPGVHLEAATKEAIQRWFVTAGTRLGPGATLLLYVTDHGSKNATDPTNNSITLWGEKTELSVVELRELLGQLDPGVRVVALMSQCFSGAFAHLSLGPEADERAAPVCGYFASTAERPAYGCYPENRGRDNVGHSFHFFQALTGAPRFPAAHAHVLVIDQTPDVPITSSDVYLESLLARLARERSEQPSVLIDGLLREAWRDKGAWEPEIRLLDRIGRAFGVFSPRSLAEVEEQARLLPEMERQLTTYANAWESAEGDLAEANLERFLVASPAWRKRLEENGLRGLDPAGRRALRGALLADLAPFTRTDSTTDARLRRLKDKADAASAPSYRMEVRLGVLLRMRAILTTIAGRTFLGSQGSEADRAAYQRLRNCEDFAFGAETRPGAAPDLPPPFPPYEEDVRDAKKVLPAWMGIRFRSTGETERAGGNLSEGAAAVVTVYPDSPAQVAGLEVGDIVIGPPGRPFAEPRQIREWTMLSEIGEPAPLTVLREGRRLELTLVPKPFPLEWPALPGPPALGSLAPRLALAAYRGALPSDLAAGTPHLLFFWATWCAPCKAALPELLDFEREQRTPVIAITDELGEHLDRFFKQYDGDFPHAVAVDEFRRAFLAYGVSGTPTFVLVDAAGAVRAYATGYVPDKGLALDGWSWAKRRR